MTVNRPIMIGYIGSDKESCSNAYILGAGYRLYSPSLMRFTSSDDWSPFGIGGFNPYTYCADDPINHCDPSGHAPWSWISALTRRFTSAFRSGAPIGADDSAAGMGSRASDTTVVVTSGRHIGAAEPRPVYRGVKRSWEATEEEREDEQERLMRFDEGRRQVMDDMLAQARAQAQERLAPQRERLARVAGAAQRAMDELRAGRPRLFRSNSMSGHYPYPGDIGDSARLLARVRFVMLARMWRATRVGAAAFDSVTAHEAALEGVRAQAGNAFRDLTSSMPPRGWDMTVQEAFDTRSPY